MAKARAARIASWIAIVVAPVIAVFLIGLATGSSPLDVDAWNTTYNDEHGYFWSVSQMQLYGEPSGMTGYNEQAAVRPSYGAYSPVVYIPYYLASFFTGVESHNFVYVANMAFGILTALLIVIVLRPSVSQSLFLAALMAFHFIIGKYLCSGMSEGTYVLFAGIVAACTLYVVKVGSAGRPPLVVLALSVSIVACAFWGCMRPFLLAYLLLPCVLAFTCGCRLRRWHKAFVMVLAVVSALVSLALYMYFAKYYVAPYFDTATIATSLTQLIAAALPGLGAQHIECVLYSAARLVHLKWQGIMVFTFALCWVILLVMGIRAARRGDKAKAGLLISLVLAGVAIFEAHLLLYSYKQMTRMFIPVDIIYLLTLIYFGVGKTGTEAPSAAGKHAKESRFGNGPSPSGKPAFIATTVTVAAVCLLCAGSLATSPESFKLPQWNDAYSEEVATSLNSELTQLMPRSEDRWDNTVVHPIESNDMWIYFAIPRYLTTNTCKDNYIQNAIDNDTFKSKYVSLPSGHWLNKKMRAKYPVLYEGQGHVIYQVHGKRLEESAS